MNVGLRTQRALGFARYEAGQLGSEVIEPIHLLLGFLRENVKVPPLGFHEIQEIHKGVIGRVSTGKSPIKTEPRYSLESSFTLQKAQEYARRWGRVGRDSQPYLEAIHVFVALMKRHTVIAKLLRSRGVDIRVIHRKMRSGKNGEFYSKV